MKRITAFAPASIGNVAAGFDVLGAALAPLDAEPWGDHVTVEAAERDRFECVGPYAARLPADPADNLVVKARQFLEAALGRGIGPARVVLDKRLPLNSGLGSSASSGVAALVACNAFAGEPLDKRSLLDLAARLEGEATGAAHVDNAAPSLLGGLQLVAPDGAVRTLPWPADLVFAVAQPELELATRESRAALPRTIALPEAVAWAQNLAAFVHALHAGDRALLAATFRDLLAEPHRAPLVRGFAGVQRAALAAGAVACSLSGSGPAVFAVAERGRIGVVAEAMQAAFQGAGVASRVRPCALDPRGARVL